MALVVGGISQSSGGVVPGNWYAGLCFVQAANASAIDTCKVGINWTSADGSIFGLPVEGCWVTPDATDWTLLEIVTVAPAAAVFGVLDLSVADTGASAVQYFSRMAITPLDGAGTGNWCYDSEFVDMTDASLPSWNVSPFLFRYNNMLQAVGNGGTFIEASALSQLHSFPVGSQVTFGAYIDATGWVGPGPVPAAVLLDQVGNTIATAFGIPGEAAQVYSTVTLGSQVSGVFLSLDNKGATWKENSFLVMGQPFIVLGPTPPSPWTPGPRWSAGGLSGLGFAQVGFSTDGGLTWTDKLNNPQVVNDSSYELPLPKQQAVIFDNEAVVGQTRTYRAQVISTT